MTDPLRAQRPVGDNGNDNDGEAIRLGFGSAFIAYLIWGFSAAYYKLLAHVPSLEIIAHRAAWSIVFVGLVLVITGRMGEVRAALGSWQALIRLAMSATLISVNWLVFIWAVNTDQVLEASLGYFMMPLVNVVMGMLFLGERLSRWQGIAVALASCAVAYQTLTLGTLPWIALILAFSFGFYGYIRKTVSAGAASGLFIETLLILPFALGYLGWLEVGEAAEGTRSWITIGMLALTGILTGLPLIFFTYGARVLRLTTIGLLQYMTPSIHFALGVLVYHEALEADKLIAFGIIWLGLLIFTVDSLISHRRRARVGYRT